MRISMMRRMNDWPREWRRGSCRRGAMQRRRWQLCARQRTSKATAIVDRPAAVRGRWQRWRWRPVMMRHLLVRRTAGLRGQRYRRSDRWFGRPAHWRTGHNPGVRLAVNVRWRRTADLWFRTSRRRCSIVRRCCRRGRGRMRMRVRIRGFGRAVR